MIPERIQQRLDKNRPMVTITLSIPVDVLHSLEEITPQRGFSGYQGLLKSYLSDGLRRDEATYLFGPAARLLDALKKRGVPEDLLQDAARDNLVTQQD